MNSASLRSTPMRAAYLYVDDHSRGVAHLYGHDEGNCWRIPCQPAARVCHDCLTVTPRLPLCGSCSISNEDGVHHEVEASPAAPRTST